MPSILIVDDEETHARALARFLGRRRYGTTVAIDAAETRAALTKSRPDLVLLDQRLGDADGIELVREAHAGDPELPIIVMTAYGSVDTAVAAMKAGARDYIQKPIDLEQLGLLVERALNEAQTQACLDRLQRAPFEAGAPPPSSARARRCSRSATSSSAWPASRASAPASTRPCCCSARPAPARAWSHALSTRRARSPAHRS